MPRIPQYENPQVQERAAPGVRQSSVASPALFSAAADQQMATGKAMSSAGNSASNIAIQMQERENADMLFRAETAVKDEYLKFEQDIRNRKGQNAWGALADTDKWFAEQEKKTSETLGNDKQRYLFSQGLTKMRQSAMSTVAQYEDSERRRSLDEAARASIVGSINMAAVAAAEGRLVGGKNPVANDDDGNPMPAAPGVNPIQGIKQDIVKRVQVMASLNGWGSERKAVEEAQHLTNLHKQVLQAMVDKNPSGAREYFEANKAEINGSEYDTITRVLQVGETKQAAFDFVNRDDIMKLGREDHQIAAARDFFKDDPEKRDAAIREVKARWTEQRQFREAGQKDAADQAWKIYSQSGSLNAVPASVLASMDGRDVETLRNHATNKASGVTVKTDPGVYYDLRRMAASDPSAFRNLDLRRYVNALSGSDFQEFVKLQTNDSEQTDAATLTQQLSNTHDLLKWGSGDREKKGMFDKAVTEAITLEQKRVGKKLGYEERQKIIDKMLIEGEVDGSGWLSDDKTYFEVAGSPDAAKFAPKIPDADRDAIVARFKERYGTAPNDAQITRIFKSMKGF